MYEDRNALIIIGDRIYWTKLLDLSVKRTKETNDPIMSNGIVLKGHLVDPPFSSSPDIIRYCEDDVRMTQAIYDCFNSKTKHVYKKVIYNPPATIVLWADGSKTVVKCSPDDVYDPEKGLYLCFMKKFINNDTEFKKILREETKNIANNQADILVYDHFIDDFSNHMQNVVKNFTNNFRIPKIPKGSVNDGKEEDSK